MTSNTATNTASTLTPGSRIRVTTTLRGSARRGFLVHSVGGWFIGMNPSPEGRAYGQAIVIWDSAPLTPTSIHRDNTEAE